MTQTLRFGPRAALLLALACVPLLAARALCAEPPAPAAGGPLPPPLPENVVARVFAPDGSLAAELTWEGLGRVLVSRVLKDLNDPGSGALTILRGEIEELLVRQEAARLGLAVSPAELAAEREALSARVRLSSGGTQTLEELRQGKGMSAERFDGMLRMEILKRKVAEHPQHLGKLPADEKQRMNQISVVIIELHKQAKLAWGVPNAMAKHVPLEPETLVLVNDAPLTRAQYGRALLESLPEDDVREALERECATKVLEAEGKALVGAVMVDELALRERLWPVQRSMMGDDRWRRLEFDQYLTGVLSRKREEIQDDRYLRSFWGLVRSLRSGITDEDVRKDFEAKKESDYGAAVLVDGLQVGFVRKAGVFGSNEGRDKRSALQVVHGALRSIATGRPFSDVAKEVVKQHQDPKTGLPDPTVREGRRRLFNSEGDKLLYDAAMLLKDGEVSTVVETLGEVYVLRRVELEPARRLEEIRDVVREQLAVQAAQKYLMDATRDVRRVQLRKPLRAR